MQSHRHRAAAAVHSQMCRDHTSALACTRAVPLEECYNNMQESDSFKQRCMQKPCLIGRLNRLFPAAAVATPVQRNFWKLQWKVLRTITCQAMQRRQQRQLKQMCPQQSSPCILLEACSTALVDASRVCSGMLACASRMRNVLFAITLIAMSRWHKSSLRR